MPSFGSIARVAARAARSLRPLRREQSSRRALLLLAGLASGVPAASALAQPAGSIVGRVQAAESGRSLAGARVQVDGTTLVALVGETGTFTLPRVPAGRVTVRAYFLGRVAAARDVEVVAGEVANVKFELETISLTPVQVRASGQADALSRQKNAVNIKNVVAADQMGRFPDASAPEAVQRLPGVALQRDQGEGRYVQLRGASAATTQVTVNGELIGSPESDSRQIALDAIPVGVLAAVEVSKAITPDMEAEAVGGSVNLVTKRAGPGRTVTVEGSGGYAPIREAGAGLGAVTYGQRTSDSRFGWLFSGSFAERNFGSDNVEPAYDGDDLEELEVRYYSLWRRRSGLTASLDFTPSTGNTFYVNSLWSELQDQEQRRIQGAVIPDGELSYAHKNRLEKLSTFNITGGGEHLLGRGMQLDYRLAFTRSQEDTPFDREAVFLQEDVSFAPDRSNVEEPQANPQGGALAGSYLFDELESGTSLTTNSDVTGGVNLAIPFRFAGRRTGTFKFGARVRSKTKDNALDYRVFGADGDLQLGRDVGTTFSNDGFAAGTYPIPFTTADDEILDFQSRFASALDTPEDDIEGRSEAFDLRERVIGTYAMATLDLSPKLLLLPGVRFERTQLESDGFSFDAENETLTPATAENSYANFFPMLHARYAVSDRTNVRAAVTTSIFRPNFFDLVPYRIVDGDDIEQGNPDLEPTTATNFDLMVERYDDNIGVISAGVFAKRLDRPIFSFTTDNGTGETTQPGNAESGEILGVELAWQQRFTSLPGLWNGLGLYANLTLTDSKATLPDGRETRLAGQSGQAFNVAVSYEKRGLFLQLALNRVGEYIDELGENAEDDLFASDRDQLDFSASYFLRPTVQIYVDALNLTNAEFRTFQGAPSFIRQRELYRPSFNVGLRVRP